MTILYLCYPKTKIKALKTALRGVFSDFLYLKNFGFVFLFGERGKYMRDNTSKCNNRFFAFIVIIYDNIRWHPHTGVQRRYISGFERADKDECKVRYYMQYDE